MRSKQRRVGRDGEGDANRGIRRYGRWYERPRGGGRTLTVLLEDQLSLLIVVLVLSSSPVLSTLCV